MCIEEESTSWRVSPPHAKPPPKNEKNKEQECQMNEENTIPNPDPLLQHPPLPPHRDIRRRTDSACQPRQGGPASALAPAFRPGPVKKTTCHYGNLTN